MYSLNFDTVGLKELVKRKMSHSYVEKYIQKPFIDEDKITILYELYKEVDLPVHIKRQTATTILLVQFALDTHELIPAQEANEMCEMEVQLSVLAGDYYSGLYYLLLSDIKNIEMVQILASSIRQINEFKMNLFYRDATTWTELMEQLKQIEASLLINTAHYLQYDKEVVALIGNILLLKRLEREKDAIENNKASYIYQFAQHQHLAGQTVLMITEEISSLRNKITKMLELFPCTSRFKEFAENTLFKQVSVKKG